jgi:hypothetical protein
MKECTKMSLIIHFQAYKICIRNQKLVHSPLKHIIIHMLFLKIILKLILFVAFF